MDTRSKYLRKLVVRGLSASSRGHIGSSMSLIEILRVLYDSFLKFDPKNPWLQDRDRFILSKGHGCLALYAILADKGFIQVEELDNFCRSNGKLGGHPEYRKIAGVEASTGALGHGLSIGVGMALASRLKNIPYRVVVVMGDGEINEGSVWEAALSAAKHRLSNLMVLVDYNKLQSYGPTKEVLDLEPLLDKWTAFGFHAVEVDGHSIEALNSVFSNFPSNNQKPTAIICHTVKGKGIPFAENQAEWHHKSSLTLDQIEALVKCLD